MNMPGFGADASLARTNVLYSAYTFANHSNRNVHAQEFTPAFDPCSHCQFLTNQCARIRCYCICNDGIPVPSRLGKCGFLCT
jgi:hypothetical protein